MRADSRTLAPYAAFALTLLAFLPAARYPFLNWDDAANLPLNPRFQGLTLEHLRWMFTTHFRGPYQPLSWLSYALDYAAGGLNPQGYHLTNIVLHALNAGLFCAVAATILEAAFGAALPPLSLSLVSGFCALFFSLHPLRVESVAWVTERRDVLSGLFFLLALRSYLQAVKAAGRPRLGLVLVFFALALLSKVTAIGLIWALLALDVSALKRLPPDPRRWTRPPHRAVLLEKLPFLILGAVLALVNLRGFATGDLNAGHYGPLQRAAIFAYGLGFYLLKTAWPSGLSPYYLLPVHLKTIAGALLFHAAVAASATAAAVKLRRRWPALLIAWLCYALILAPVGGLAQNGQQLAADRYSYLACLPFALLAGGALALLARAGKKAAAAGAGALILLCFAGLTVAQTRLWRDDVALWTRAVELSPNNYLAQSNLATEFFTRGDDERARRGYEAALRLSPRDAQAHLNLGVLYERHGEYPAALAHDRAALALNPSDQEARNNLAVVLIKQGDWRGAATQFEAMLESRPDFAQARFNLGLLLCLHGHRAQGLPHLRRALELQPDLIERLPPGAFPELKPAH